MVSVLGLVCQFSLFTMKFHIWTQGLEFKLRGEIWTQGLWFGLGGWGLDLGVGFWTQELGLDSDGRGFDSGVRFWTLGAWVGGKHSKLKLIKNDPTNLKKYQKKGRKTPLLLPIRLKG